ncbi:hypothetical protein OE699_12680 [Sedimentimonas flavescens]|uniref:Uncharacterized protein n=1 Tax=Sedimentimonas flavescens TaxID=2851012 RepID=A0ABT3A182_9RHOB|nr:hypothetical protein [Sedimentimonas flavescens]MCV2879703.1 hypothetical protein [Sedimentimonas flavescens]
MHRPITKGFCVVSRLDTLHDVVNPVPSRVATACTNPQIWLENRALYGDLADETCFAEAFGKWPR